jgi:hypothetical protein
MTAPFIRITDTHGWIGRIGWIAVCILIWRTTQK